MNFEPAPFKDCMKEFGFTVLASSKLNMVMEKWRHEAINFKERNAGVIQKQEILPLLRNLQN